VIENRGCHITQTFTKLNDWRITNSSSSSGGGGGGGVCEAVSECVG